MPVVHADIRRHFSGSVNDIRLISEEVVPAGMNSPEDEDGKLCPGDIEFLTSRQDDEGLKTDILITITAFSYPGRIANKDERNDAIRAAYHELMPGTTFAVFIIPVENGSWSSDVPDDEVDVDMSMEAAIARARERMRTSGNIGEINHQTRVALKAAVADDDHGRADQISHEESMASVDGFSMGG